MSYPVSVFGALFAANRLVTLAFAVVIGIVNVVGPSAAVTVSIDPLNVDLVSPTGTFTVSQKDNAYSDYTMLRFSAASSFASATTNATR